MRVRNPFISGSWYPSQPDAINKQIEECFSHRFGPGKPTKKEVGKLKRIVGFITPHAGYMFSGSVAAHAYYNLAMDGKPDTVVLFGPNHTGRGNALAIMSEGVWRTPLGDVEIDTETARRIMQESSIIDVDDSAHRFEHSIEVQLPFLQYLYGQKLKFVPVCFLMQDLESSRGVGEAVAKALSGKNALIIASTDMTHYEPQERAEQKDRLAIDAAIKMDVEIPLDSTVE